MCTYITGVLPDSADTTNFRSVVSRHKLAFEPLSNRHVTAQLATKERYYGVTRGRCDCGTSLGLIGDEDVCDDHPFERQIMLKLHKKGWSETKIARWFETTRESSRRKPDMERLLDAARPRPESWINFLDEALKLPEVPFVGLIMREYHHRIDSARFNLAGRVTVDVDWLVDPSRRWVDGRLYEFRASEHAD